MKIRGKQGLLREGLRDLSESGHYNNNNIRNDSNFDEYSKFYKIPKKGSYNTQEHRQSRLNNTKLDYHSSSAFKLNNINYNNDQNEPRNKVRTHM